MKKIVILLFILVAYNLSAQSIRERINFDDNWYFSFGHPFDKTKDFNTGTGYFSYLAKAGYGDGAAAKDFDHRAWRPIDLPHDWAVEMPFDAKGSHSHGYKAVGPGFPDVSVGWYRKSFKVNKEDLGKQFFIDFDGVSRDAKVWVNGHYLGCEPSGYQSFSYNITDILNYGGDNVVAVRADVSTEEGWYYEGAGIYRHVWMRKTNALHIPKDGTFVYADITDSKANVTIETEIENRGLETSFYILKQMIKDKDGKVIAEGSDQGKHISSMDQSKNKSSLHIKNPHLWSLEEPYLYSMLTQVISDGVLVDEYTTPFGIRSIHFDADKGFFLNGKHIKLKGTNNHQDHAGVGTAMPDELIRWRLQQLKNFGSNAVRSSHNPPTPEMLQLCDEMGILVIDENRLMGTTDKALHELERLMKRDRNHPSVIVWSLGNEEWGIECNVIGEQITPTMQNFAKRIDPSRPINVAISGGCNKGISSVVDIVGFNYLGQWDTDRHHAMFPTQPSIGTEEGSTYATRGIYMDDDDKQYRAAYDRKPRENWYSIEEAWQHYAERDYLSGMFIWTGFDYRGEPTPYTWPSVTSYFGMMDLCGFPKDNVYYLKSWWQNEPVLHILPHWNHKGKEGETIDVWVYSNCNEVELWLNNKKLSRRTMPKNGHLQWAVPYEAGTIKAIGYRDGVKQLTAQRTTTGEAYAIKLSSGKSRLKNDNSDVAMVTVEVVDENGNTVPTANQEIKFTLAGEGKIIGVGNGDPTSLAKERFVETYKNINLAEVSVQELSDEFIKHNLSSLSKSELKSLKNSRNTKVKALTLTFELNEELKEVNCNWFYKNVATTQFIYLNGQLIQANVNSQIDNNAFKLQPSLLHKGTNQIVIVGEPFIPKHKWDNPNAKPGIIQLVYPAEQYKRELFNGLAQVIVQSKEVLGEITLKAESAGLKSAVYKISVD